MKSFSFLVVLFMTFIACSGQNLIGYSSKDITNYMSSDKGDTHMDRVNNKIYRYLKFTDKYDTQTMLFFLNTDSVCNYIRIICNNSIRGVKVKELDSTFEKKGENFWIDKRSDKKYLIRLVDEEWSFTITMEPEK
jgi:hypothetical protein